MKNNYTKEELIEWFLEHYEDPAEHTPYESKEGGYIYIFGGPCDAREELEQYFDNVTQDILNEAVLELEKISMEWAKIPDEEDIIDFALEQKNIITELTDEKISHNAFEYVKSNKQFFIDLIFKFNKQTKKIIFMAGGPGAGKTEMAMGISRKLKIDTIEADQIRQYCPHYNGHNSHLFQRASSKAVNILVDYALKHNISFILDGNFANYKIQKENIDRALKKGYEIEIRFINTDIYDAKRYTEIREAKEGRKITTEVFKEKFINSIETVSKFFDTVPIHYYDMNNKKVIQSIDYKTFTNKLQKNIDIVNNQMSNKT